MRGDSDTVPTPRSWCSVRVRDVPFRCFASPLLLFCRHTCIQKVYLPVLLRASHTQKVDARVPACGYKSKYPGCICSSGRLLYDGQLRSLRRPDRPSVRYSRLQDGPRQLPKMSGFKRFIELIEVDHPKRLTQTELFLSVRPNSIVASIWVHSPPQNADLRPVPPKNRTWRAWNFVAL